MTDVKPVSAAKQRTVKTRSRMFDDPVVRLMAWAVALIVVMFLAFVVAVLALGFYDPVAPRTFTESRLADNEALVAGGSTDPAVWQKYVGLLIEEKQYAKAQSAIDRGKKAIDDSWDQGLLYMQARLYLEQGEESKALKTAEDAQKKIEKAYKDELATGTKPNRAASFGVSENYWLLFILKSDIYAELGKFKLAQDELQKYVDENPLEAGALIDLADLKVKTGDKDGARADYEKALKYMPEDPQALAGLRAIGAK